MIRIPRRRREPIEKQQRQADAALRETVNGLHAEVVQLQTVQQRTPVALELGRRFLGHQERNHFGSNMARIMGEPR